jgi:hypothetical protein
VGQVVGHDGSFRVVVGSGFPPDTEHDFPTQLKGICTPASAIFPEKEPPGTGGSRREGAPRQISHQPVMPREFQPADRPFTLL